MLNGDVMLNRDVMFLLLIVYFFADRAVEYSPDHNCEDVWFRREVCMCAGYGIQQLVISVVRTRITLLLFLVSL